MRYNHELDRQKSEVGDLGRKSKVEGKVRARAEWWRSIDIKFLVPGPNQTTFVYTTCLKTSGATFFVFFYRVKITKPEG